MADNTETLEELQRTGGAVITPASMAAAQRGQQYAAEAQAMERQPAAATPPMPDVAGAYERQAKSIEAAGVKKGELESQIAQKGAEQQRQIAAEFEPQFKKTPEFQAPKEEGQQIAGLIAMMGALAAFGGGKSYGSALTAMNAMAGMLNGYREGRKEVFDKAKAEYDKSVQAIKAHNDQITAAYNRALKMAPANLTAATAQLRSELIALDAKLQAEAVRVQGPEKAAQAWQNSRTAELRLAQLQRTIDRQSGQLQGRASEPVVAVEDRENPGKYIFVPRSETVRAAQEGRPYTPAPRQPSSSPGGVIQFRYNQAIVNAVNQASVEVENYGALPLRAAPPAASNVLTDPSKGITEAATRYFAQGSTPAENRAVQQVTAGLNRAIAAIAAGGRPGGITEASIKEFTKMAPLPGDKKINTFLYLAMIRQEFDIAVKDLKAAKAAPEQIQAAEAARDRAYQAIPFTAQDVIRVIRSGGPTLVNNRTEELIKTSTNLNRFERAITSEQKVRSTGEEARQDRAPASTKTEESANKKAARSAIAAGANREAVIKRLQDAGEDISGL